MAWWPRFSVELAGLQPITRGHQRLIFEHPDFPGALIKVIDPDLVDASGHMSARYRPPKRFFRRRIGRFLSVQREMAEFLTAHTRLTGRDTWPIARILGFVETDLGLGLVVERVAGADGGLAPTLHELLQSGRIEAAHRPAVLHLFSELSRLHICIGSMHVKNIVFTGRLGEGGRFVGVDGLGEKGFIPLADWSKTFNDYRLKGHAAKILSRVDARLAKLGRPVRASAAEPAQLDTR